MRLILILILLGLGGALVARRKGAAWAGPVLALLTILALVAGGVMLVKRIRAPTPATIVMNAQADAARALGEQLAALVPGGPILVLNYAPAGSQRLFTDARWDGLCQALTNPAYHLIAAGPQVVPDAQPPPGFLVFSHEKLAAGVNAWLAANPDTKAVISLMPYPPAGLQLGSRPLFAFAVAELEGWAAGLRSGTWKAALISRRTIVAKDGQAPEDWESIFNLVTPATLDAYQKSVATPPSP